MIERHIAVHVPVLARVEGEGALHLEIHGGAIERLQLEIYEPPRLFEQFVVGRECAEVPDMVARICGICPVAYQMTAVAALEQALGVEVTPWVRAMRKVLYFGEWIQSHALHIHLLAAPDFLGFASVIEMAAEHREAVARGLALQGLGNDLMALLGGRSVHPVGVCVGGFHTAPGAADVALLARRLRDALPQADALIEWTASLPVSEDAQDFVSVALRDDDAYAIDSGAIVSDAGLQLGPEHYEQRFAEHQEAHSTALYSLLDGEPYLVGPLARVNLNASLLPAAMLAASGVEWPSRNMFHSMVARAIEIRYALQAAAELLEAYETPARSRVEYKPRAGVGYGATEAPRGILWHRYELDADGAVVAARIVPPTSQNQARIEADLRASLEAFGLEHGDDELRLHCEKVIRNYDPCISCATHFLRLHTERS